MPISLNLSFAHKVVLFVTLPVTGFLLYLLLRKDEDDYEPPPKEVLTSRHHVIELNVPKHAAGAIIGPQGSQIKKIQESTGARVNFREDTDHTGEDRVVLVRGTDEQAQQAELMIRKILSDIPPIIEEVFYVHQRALGRIIGKSGETVRNIQRMTKTRVKIDRNPTKSEMKEIVIRGIPSNVANAKGLIEEKIEEDEVFRAKMSISAAHRSSRLGGQTRRNVNAASGAIRESKTKNGPTLEEESVSGEPSVISMGQGQLSEWPKQRKDYFEVYVSAVEHPGHFWVQVISPESVRLDTLIQDMNKYYSVQPKMHGSTDYKVGDIVAAPFVEDKSFYRARVEEVEEDKLDLYFLDFGDSEFVNASEVFPLRFVPYFDEYKPEWWVLETMSALKSGERSDHLDLPFLAFECCMGGIEPVESQWSEAAIVLFEELIHVAKWKVIMCKTLDYKDTECGHLPCVQLVDTNTAQDRDIANELVTQGFARYTDVSLTEGPALATSGQGTVVSQKPSLIYKGNETHEVVQHLTEKELCYFHSLEGEDNLINQIVGANNNPETMAKNGDMERQSHAKGFLESLYQLDSFLGLLATVKSDTDQVAGEKNVNNNCETVADNCTSGYDPWRNDNEYDNEYMSEKVDSDDVEKVTGEETVAGVGYKNYSRSSRVFLHDWQDFETNAKYEFTRETVLKNEGAMNKHETDHNCFESSEDRKHIVTSDLEGDLYSVTPNNSSDSFNNNKIQSIDGVCDQTPDYGSVFETNCRDPANGVDLLKSTQSKAQDSYELQTDTVDLLQSISSDAFFKNRTNNLDMLGGSISVSSEVDPDIQLHTLAFREDCCAKSTTHLAQNLPDVEVKCRDETVSCPKGFYEDGAEPVDETLNKELDFCTVSTDEEQTSLSDVIVGVSSDSELVIYAEDLLREITEDVFEMCRFVDISPKSERYTCEKISVVEEVPVDFDLTTTEVSDTFSPKTEQLSTAAGSDVLEFVNDLIHEILDEVFERWQISEILSAELNICDKVVKEVAESTHYKANMRTMPGNSELSNMSEDALDTGKMVALVEQPVESPGNKPDYNSDLSLSEEESPDYQLESDSQDSLVSKDDTCIVMQEDSLKKSGDSVASSVRISRVCGADKVGIVFVEKGFQASSPTSVSLLLPMQNSISENKANMIHCSGGNHALVSQGFDIETAHTESDKNIEQNFEENAKEIHIENKDVVHTEIFSEKLGKPQFSPNDDNTDHSALEVTNRNIGITEAVALHSGSVMRGELDLMTTGIYDPCVVNERSSNCSDSTSSDGNGMDSDSLYSDDSLNAGDSGDGEMGHTLNAMDFGGNDNFCKYEDYDAGLVTVYGSVSPEGSVTANSLQKSPENQKELEHMDTTGPLYYLPLESTQLERVSLQLSGVMYDSLEDSAVDVIKHNTSSLGHHLVKPDLLSESGEGFKLLCSHSISEDSHVSEQSQNSDHAEQHLCDMEDSLEEMPDQRNSKLPPQNTGDVTAPETNDIAEARKLVQGVHFTFSNEGELEPNSCRSDAFIDSIDVQRPTGKQKHVSDGLSELFQDTLDTLHECDSADLDSSSVFEACGKYVGELCAESLKFKTGSDSVHDCDIKTKCLPCEYNRPTIHSTQNVRADENIDVAESDNSNNLFGDLEAGEFGGPTLGNIHDSPESEEAIILMSQASSDVPLLKDFSQVTPIRDNEMNTGQVKHSYNGTQCYVEVGPLGNRSHPPLSATVGGEVSMTLPNLTEGEQAYVPISDPLLHKSDNVNDAVNHIKTQNESQSAITCDQDMLSSNMYDSLEDSIEMEFDDIKYIDESNEDDLKSAKPMRCSTPLTSAESVSDSHTVELMAMEEGNLNINNSNNNNNDSIDQPTGDAFSFGRRVLGQKGIRDRSDYSVVTVENECSGNLEPDVCFCTVFGHVEMEKYVQVISQVEVKHPASSACDRLLSQTSLDDVCVHGSTRSVLKRWKHLKHCPNRTSKNVSFADQDKVDEFSDDSDSSSDTSQGEGGTYIVSDRTNKESQGQMKRQHRGCTMATFDEDETAF